MATRLQKILDELEPIEKAVNKFASDNRLRSVNKPMDKDSDAYKNKRNVYVNKLNNQDILSFQKRDNRYVYLLWNKSNSYNEIV